MQHSPALRDDRLAGNWSGIEPGWSEARVEAWLHVFLALGVVLRLARLALCYPLWRDEAYLAANVLERDFAALMRPLDDQQVCPLLFLWAEKAISLTIGFGATTLRLLPTIAAVAALFLLRHVAGRLLKGPALVFAVAILAIGYTPIRHGGEVKPYATDLLVALGLIGLAVEWLRAPDRNRFLWALAALGPVAIGLSNPAIFVAAGVGIVLAGPVLRTRSAGAIGPLAVYGAGVGATFLTLLRLVNAPQAAAVMDWMRVYWADAFPPRSPLLLLRWLAEVHTSHMFAYPAGGDHGASTATTALSLVGAVAFLRRGSRAVLALLMAPFLLGLIAAALGRYPYGGSARTMQYVAPSIILLAGLGLAVALARLPRPRWRARLPGRVLAAFVAIGLGMLAWDVARPYKEPGDRSCRAFARRFWAEESRDAELVCAREDLHLPLHRPTALYLCHRQIFFGGCHRSSLDRVGRSHPLRVVVFNEDARDADTVARWIDGLSGRFRLRSRRERVRNRGVYRGSLLEEERYCVYELVPLATQRRGRCVGCGAIPSRADVGPGRWPDGRREGCASGMNAPRSSGIRGRAVVR